MKRSFMFSIALVSFFSSVVAMDDKMPQVGSFIPASKCWSPRPGSITPMSLSPLMRENQGPLNFSPEDVPAAGRVRANSKLTDSIMPHQDAVLPFIVAIKAGNDQGFQGLVAQQPALFRDCHTPNSSAQIQIGIIAKEITAQPASPQRTAMTESLVKSMKATSPTQANIAQLKALYNQQFNAGASIPVLQRTTERIKYLQHS